MSEKIRGRVIKVPADTARKIDRIAREQRRNLGVTIAVIVDEYLEREKAERKLRETVGV